MAKGNGMKIAFVWQGIKEHFDSWNDGLKKAMLIIEQTHEVKYFEPNQTDDIKWFNPNVVLYWEAPCTINGQDKDNYISVRDLPFKKALLFAGGPIEAGSGYGFDLFFVESRINEEECEQWGIPYKRAFGVNDSDFRPEKQPKVFDGIHHATCASWKRQPLLAEALKDKAVIVGRYQKNDPYPFDRSKELGALVLPQADAHMLRSLINASHTVVNTSEFWGGGQRCTLEAMACGVPPIVMSDSPKNREYVEESGFGAVCDPNVQSIKEAVEKLKGTSPDKGVEYIKSKWSAQHYANALLEGIKIL